MMNSLWPRKSIQFLSVILRTAFLKYFWFQDPIIVLKIVKNPEELLFMYESYSYQYFPYYKLQLRHFKNLYF